MRGDGPGAVVSAVKGVLHAYTVLFGPRSVRPGPTPGADAHIPAHTHTHTPAVERKKEQRRRC